MSDGGPAVAVRLRRRFWPEAAPYLVGIAHLGACALLFRFVRGTFLGGDSGEYLQLANDWLSGALRLHADNGKPLGYPLVLALLMRLPGDIVPAAVAFNWACYLWTLLAVGRTAGWLGCSPRAGRAAQLGMALIPNLAFWANLLLSETLSMALLVSGCWMSLCATRATTARRRLGASAVLGACAGLLGLTRTEYVLLLAFCTALLAARRPPQAARWERPGRLAVLWLCGLPWLAVQPAISGWHGPASIVPPRQSAFLEVWRSWYDLEFTHLRWHKLRELVHEPGRDAAWIQGQVAALATTADRAGQVPGPVIVQATEDIVRLRQLILVRGLHMRDAYRQVALERLREDPWGYVARAGRRLWRYVTAADLDWPPDTAAHWLFTMVLRPVSVGAYALLALMVAAGVPERRTIVELGLWSSAVVVIHSAFIFDQRLLYPSVPLLCVVWAVAAQRLRLLRWHPAPQRTAVCNG